MASIAPSNVWGCQGRQRRQTVSKVSDSVKQCQTVSKVFKTLQTRGRCGSMRYNKNTKSIIGAMLWLPATLLWSQIVHSLVCTGVGKPEIPNHEFEWKFDSETGRCIFVLMDTSISSQSYHVATKSRAGRLHTTCVTKCLPVYRCCLQVIKCRQAI